MASAATDCAWVAEIAGEELRKLEVAHPGLFGPLKAELNRLISQHGRLDDASLLPAFPLASAHDGTAAAATTGSSAPARSSVTQESSNRKRKCATGGVVVEEVKGARGQDRAEMAIERAERCLKRIRAIKQSLLGFTD